MIKTKIKGLFYLKDSIPSENACPTKNVVFFFNI